MPFLEVFDFDATPERREAAVTQMTAALCDAYSIAADIVSVYFFGFDGSSYGHAGILHRDPQTKRFFIKVHAFRKSDQMRRLAAKALTRAAADAYGVPSKSIIVYFVDRDPDQVSHDGALASD